MNHKSDNERFIKDLKKSSSGEKKVISDWKPSPAQEARDEQIARLYEEFERYSKI